MPIAISDGMSFDEILSYGESDNLFATLKSSTLNQAAFDLNLNARSSIAKLIDQLEQSQNADEQSRIAAAIAAYLTGTAVTLDNEIQADLQAQQEVKTQLANLNIAAELAPPADTKVPELVDLIATDTFKDIFSQ